LQLPFFVILWWKQASICSLYTYLVDQMKSAYQRQKNTHKDEEVEDKHEVLDAAEAVSFHARPPR